MQSERSCGAPFSSKQRSFIDSALDLTSAGLQGLGIQGFLAACLDSSSMVFLEMLSDFIRELSPKHPDSTISTKFPHSVFRPSGLENLFIPVQLDLCPVVADSEQFA